MGIVNTRTSAHSSEKSELFQAFVRSWPSARIGELQGHALPSNQDHDTIDSSELGPTASMAVGLRWSGQTLSVAIGDPLAASQANEFWSSGDTLPTIAGSVKGQHC